MDDKFTIHHYPESKTFVMHVPYNETFVKAVKNPEDEFYMDYDLVHYDFKTDTRTVDDVYLPKMLLAKYVFFNRYSAEYVDVSPNALETAYVTYQRLYKNKAITKANESELAEIEEQSQNLIDHYVDFTEVARILSLDYSDVEVICDDPNSGLHKQKVDSRGNRRFVWYSELKKFAEDRGLHLL
jgi:hypothetical protein